MVTLRHITAAEVRNQQKERVREIKRERERERKEPQPKEREREREKETGLYSMIGFDTATSSFDTANLVNK